MPQCFISGFWEYHSITDQHKSSHRTHFHQTTVSHENMGLSWTSSLYGPGQASLQRAQIQSHWQFHAFSCPVHFVTANISGQQQKILCHVIILCHYMGSSQILPSQIQACGVIKAFSWSACWLEGWKWHTHCCLECKSKGRYQRFCHA